MLTRMRDDAGHMMPPEVRLAAAGSLASLRIEQSSPESVAREFLNAPTPTVRAQAAFVLGQMKRREHLQAVEGLLDDPHPAVRVTAAAAILRISDSGQMAAAAP
jgi:HEAT repeat protein